MRGSDLIAVLREAPLVASLGASDAALAPACRDAGVRAFLVKSGPRPAIERTLAFAEVANGGLHEAGGLGGAVSERLRAGFEGVALDAVPGGTKELAGLCALVKAAGALAAVRCADPGGDASEARAALDAGADVLALNGADLARLRAPAAEAGVPILVEGEFSARWQVEAALRAGAAGVVLGEAQLRAGAVVGALSPRGSQARSVGAVDIGGTWARFGVFGSDWTLGRHERVANPHDQAKLLDWLRSQIRAAGVERVGVSSAGIVDPATGEVWKAKEYLIPNHVGIRFTEATLGAPTVAWGDGHATAWGHACLPAYAGRRVATIAIGTGVGCGFVREGEIWAGRRGEYPRLNDLRSEDGRTYEDLMGGIHLTKTPTEAQEAAALVALRGARAAVEGMFFPDDVLVAGGVGASDWMAPHLAADGLTPSPFGGDAGLYGAAALALFR